MKGISAIIIAKNAEFLLADCLDSLDFCDEKVVVDGGSDDNTVALAKRMGAKVVKGSEVNFAEQRNIGMKEAKFDWLLYVDTDERITGELAKEIKLVISEPLGEVGAYTLTRQNFYFGNHAWPKQEHLERLFHKNMLIEWYGQVHESPRVKGKVGSLSSLLLHYTHRDIASMVAKTLVWSEIEAKLRFDAHHPPMVWWRFLRVIVTGFWDSYITQEGWKVGTVGLIESIYQSFSMFITYSRLWEMQQKKKH